MAAAATTLLPFTNQYARSTALKTVDGRSLKF